MAALVRAAARGRCPVLVAGGGVHLSDAARAVADLQEHGSIPIATTTMGKGSVDELHPLSLGVVSNYMGRTLASHHLRGLVHDADVVVFVGSRTNENGTDAWHAFPADAAFIQVDVDSTEIGRNYEPVVRLPGDARLTCEALLAELEGLDLGTRRAARPDLEARIADARRPHLEAIIELLAGDSRPIRPERVAVELDGALADRRALVAADASYSTIWMGNYLRCGDPGSASCPLGVSPA